MKVKCIDNEGVESCLTIGEIYSAQKHKRGYEVIDDDGNATTFRTSRFEVLEDDADMVHHPSHYNYKSLECQDIISIMTEGLEGEEAYCLGCAIKYLYRYPNKGKPIEDLRKAKTYIDMIIDITEEE